MLKGVLLILSMLLSMFSIVSCQPNKDNNTGLSQDVESTDISQAASEDDDESDDFIFDKSQGGGMVFPDDEW